MPMLIPGDIKSAIEAKLATAPKGFSDAARQMLKLSLELTTSGAIHTKDKVWRPKTEAIIVNGDLEIAGNIAVKTLAKSDHTLLFVLGSVKCKNFIMSADATFICCGDIDVSEVMSCTAADSVSQVAGAVRAKILDSGSGAWLELYDKKKLHVDHLLDYVMIDDDPVEPKKKPDMTKLLVKAAIETEEWDDLDYEDREGEDMADYISLNEEAVWKMLAAGKSILKA